VSSCLLFTQFKVLTKAKKSKKNQSIN